MTDPESAQLSDLLASHGLRCAKLESLSPAGRGRKAGRRALRVETLEGRVLKLRLFESAEEAAALAALRARVDVPFLPPIERRGPLLLEPWIEGERLSPAQAEARAEALGSLLGRLHAARPADAPARVSSRERRERALGGSREARHRRRCCRRRPASRSRLSSRAGIPAALPPCSCIATSVPRTW